MRFGPDINRTAFIELFYHQKLTTKEVANKLGVAPQSISTYRYRNKFPKRGWTRHPFQGKHHSAASREKMRYARQGKMSGASNPMWKGGKYVDVSGYRWVLSPNGLKSNHGYIKEHRLVIEQHIGRRLKPNEIVHHINGDKLDNRILNLCIHTRSSHGHQHFPKGSKFGINSSTVG